MPFIGVSRAGDAFEHAAVPLIVFAPQRFESPVHTWSVLFPTIAVFAKVRME